MGLFKSLTLIVLLIKTVQMQDCTCDLTGNICDLNCCCDVDCTENQKLVFSSCIPNQVNRIEEICVSDNILFSSNGKYQAEGNGLGLFCVYNDNYEARHSYSTVQMVTTQSAFETLAQPYQTSSFAPQATSMDANLQNTFKAGDVLFVLHDVVKEQGYLVQPTSFLNNQCVDENPARFLFSNTSSCARVITQLSTQCNSIDQWNTKKYSESFKVAPYPSSVRTTNDSSLFITPSVQCLKNGQVVPQCDAPTWNGTHCDDVMLEVTYDIKYKINTTTQISQVAISVVLGSLSNGLTAFQQTFSYKFSEDNAINANTTVIKRSGNPGYITGLPIISGKLLVNPDTLIESIDTSNGSLSVIQSSQDGTCSTSMKRQSVQFGIDYQAACFYLLNNGAMSLADCQKVQQDIYSTLLVDLPTRIAPFGNSLSQQVNDWVTVIDVIPTSTPSVSNGYCTNMVTDVHFQFLYAKTGYFVNPQDKIVGFEVKYGSAKDLRPQCSGLFCQSVNRVLVTQSVSFFDVSSTPESEVKPKPKFRSKAPHDFFYPFL